MATTKNPRAQQMVNNVIRVYGPAWRKLGRHFREALLCREMVSHLLGQAVLLPVAIDVSSGKEGELMDDAAIATMTKEVVADMREALRILDELEKAL